MFFMGSFLLVFFVGLAEGTYKGMITLGTRVWSGDFQIMESTYHDKPALYKTIPIDILDPATHPNVLASAGRVECYGLLALENKTIGTLLCGLEPDAELKVSSFSKTLESGSWWHSPRDPGLAIPLVAGKNVLKRLHAELGDELSFVSQAADGALAADLFVITGILSTGIAELDREAVFIPLQEAQTLLSLGHRVHKIVGIVDDRSGIPDLINAFNHITPPSPDEQAVMLSWNQIMPELQHTIKADREGLYLFLMIIMAVVLLGVANTMMMSVMERRFELGLLQAIGTSPFALVRIILSEILWLGLIGIGSGVLLGILTIYLFGDTGVPMGGYSFSYGGVTVDKMRPILTFNGVVVFPLYILLSGLVSGLIPAIKAAHTLPARAMGRTL
jgi:ABC-type lipoprotein release transport system permease subunit